MWWVRIFRMSPEPRDPLPPPGDPGSPVCRWCAGGKRRVTGDALVCEACDAVEVITP